MKIVILAGGQGSRLWPLSLKSYPKPLLRFGGGYSLLQKTLLRFLGTYDPSSIVVVTGKEIALHVEEQCYEVDETKKVSVLAESSSQGTAAAFALALRFLQTEKKLEPEEPVFFVPSDGLVFPLDNFLEAVSSSQERAEEGDIVLFGVSPTRLETSYGYIKLGVEDRGFFIENQFVEKPDEAKAVELIAEGRVLWNTGHVLLHAKTFWEEVDLYLPKLGELKELSWEESNEVLSQMPNTSIDYALLEKSKKVVACNMAVGWSDLGTWDRVYEAFEKDEQGNVQIGDITSIDSKNNFLLSEKKKVVTIGLEDVVVVETDEALFLAKKDEAHKIGAMIKKSEEVRV